MRKTIVVCDNAENEYTMVLTVEILSSGLDLNSAIHSAALEYCRSEMGRNTYAWTGKHFNWGDFIDNVPADICQKHGFAIISDSRADMVVELNEQLVDEEDLGQSSPFQ